jgi:hypothetical protein
MASESDSKRTFDPRRRLCPDGSCIGIIGSDGKCSVCGTLDRGAAAQSDVIRSPPSDTADDLNVESDETAADEDTADGSASGFDPNRRLCSDDDCIGVIGQDNRCRVCGKPA